MYLTFHEFQRIFFFSFLLITIWLHSCLQIQHHRIRQKSFGFCRPWSSSIKRCVVPSRSSPFNPWITKSSFSSRSNTHYRLQLNAQCTVQCTWVLCKEEVYNKCTLHSMITALYSGDYQVYTPDVHQMQYSLHRPVCYVTQYALRRVFTTCPTLPSTW